MLEPQFESALQGKAAPDLSIELREISERGMIDLRGFLKDKKFVSAVKSVLGIDLPKAPRTSATWGDIKALWLSPDQWLIICARGKAESLVAELTKALAGVHSLVVNVSDMRTVLRLEGKAAREVIMKGATLDLTDGAYVQGCVRRMRFAEIAALLHIVENDVIDIYVFRSYAVYAWDFICKAARKGAEVKLFPNAG
jgi:sarcosine oxidase, subunit gamma